MSENLPETIANRYRVLRRLGAGGIGVVYQAFDPVLDKNVAVKVLLHASDDLKLRFHKEAKAAGKLKHQNIISVFDFGLTKEQQPYMVMECVEGTTLAQRLKGGDGLSLPEAFGIIVQICDGLEHAHNNGVLHRDIKPGNIMLREVSGEEPEVIIVDFGLAKLWSSEQSMTASGEMMGSPYYMSPEQVTGGEVDARADIYSLGCVMFELLTGRPPFKGPSAQETMTKHLNEPQPSLSSVGSDRFDPVLEAIVARCLAKNKDGRFKSIDALRIELLKFWAAADTEFGDSSDVVAPDVVESKKPPERRSSRRNLLLAAVVTLLAVSALLVVNLSIERERQDSLNSYKEVVKRVDATRSKENVDYLKPLGRLGEEYVAVGPELNPQALHRMAVDGDVERYSRAKIDEALSNPYAVQVELAGLRLTKADEARLTSMRNLEVLSWHHAQHISDSVFHGLCRSTKLRNLNLKQSKISDSILESIGKMKGLETLSLTGAYGFTNRGLSNLVNNKRLSNLSLEAFVALDNEGLKYVSQMSGLVALSIDRTNKYDSAGFAQIANLKKLRGFVMTLEELSEPQIKQRYATMASMKSLETLGIRYADFNNVGILSSLPKLYEISVRGSDFSGGIKPILGLKIKALGFFRGPIDKKTTHTLARSNLKVITFHECQFGPGAVAELKNAKNLSGVEFIHCEGDKDAMHELGRTLKGCRVKIQNWVI